MYKSGLCQWLAVVSGIFSVCFCLGRIVSADLVSDDQLVAYWPFDVDGTDIAGGYHASLESGAVVSHEEGDFRLGGGALKLDGEDDVAVCDMGSDLADLTTRSVSLWFMASEMAAENSDDLLIAIYPYWEIHRIRIQDEILICRIYAETRVLANSKFTVMPGEWYHLVMIYDDEYDRKIHLYINGKELEYKNTYRAEGDLYSSSTIPLTIGGDRSGHYAFDGCIDEVRLYRRVLTKTEIFVLFQNSDRVGYSGGDGTEENPFQISSVDDLVSLRNHPLQYDSHFILTADLDLNGQVFDTAVIGWDLNSWDDLEFDGEKFTGVFDGNGHTLSNLTIMGGDKAYIGLFGYIGEGGVVKDVVLKDVTVSGDYGVGGLCGQNAGVIQRCEVTGMVRATNTWCGGVCGKNFTQGTIIQCSGHGSIEGRAITGGVCGMNFGTIADSLATAGVTGSYEVGGLCGSNAGGRIERCSASGVVTGLKSTTGGLCGSNGPVGIIRQSFASGAVICHGEDDSMEGGLCGGNGKGSQISHCYSSGRVESSGIGGGLCGSNVALIQQSYSVGEVMGASGSGGFCGENNDRIRACYWDREAAEIDSSSGGRGRSTVEMKQAAWYYGWEDGNWIIDGGMDYPRLAWEDKDGDPIMTNYPERTYGGNGTAEEPFQIDSKEDIICLSERVCDWTAGTYFIVESDIDLAGYSFNRAVTGSEDYFQGVLDGNGKLIRNLVIEAESINRVGLIGILGEHGIVKNLGLERARISGGSLVGGIVGHNKGLVIGCYDTGDIQGWGDHIGGICGFNSGSIEQSYTHSAIYAGPESECVGGLYGYNASGIIDETYAVGTIRGGITVGGLSGSFSSIGSDKNYWDGEVSGRTRLIDTGHYLTSNQMKEGTLGWQSSNDFGPVWKNIRPGYDYPRLNWQVPIEGDISGLWGVDGTDLAEWTRTWGQGDTASGDIDQNGRLELGDFAIMSRNWNHGIFKLDQEHLMAHWTFDTDGQDKVGSNHCELLYGSVISQAPGEFKCGSGALKLDGNDDEVACGMGGDIRDLSIFTISLWMKVMSRPETRASGMIINQSRMWGFYLTSGLDGTLSADTGHDGAKAISQFTPDIGVWYHVVMTYDCLGDATISMYVNGVEVEYKTNASAISLSRYATKYPLSIGNTLDGLNGFNGCIDDVRIYRRVLSDDEIETLWVENKGL